MPSVEQPLAWDPEVIDQVIPLLPEVSESRTRSDTSEEPPLNLGEEVLKARRKAEGQGHGRDRPLGFIGQDRARPV